MQKGLGLQALGIRKNPETCSLRPEASLQLFLSQHYGFDGLSWGDAVGGGADQGEGIGFG